jgi:PAS domain S-box-containing protein
MHRRTAIFRKIFRHGGLWLLAFFCFQAGGTPLFSAAPVGAFVPEFHGKRILLLHSYHHGFSHTRKMSRAIERLLEPAGIHLYLEYMDTKRHFTASHMDRLTRALAFRYAAIPMDAIIATDDNAVDFLLENRDSLFPGVPVVFCGANDFDPERLTGKTGYTGVNEALSIQETLDAALRLHPEAREVAAISDVTETGRQNLERLKALTDQYAERVRFRYLVGPPRARLREILANVPPKDVVLYLSYFRTEAEENLSIPESVNFVSRHSPAPVYALWDFTMGHGAVGGKMVSSEAQGIAAGQLALQLLSGVSADALPVVMKSPNRYIFDHAQLRRFHVSIRDLPEGSRLINRTVPPLLRYLPWIIGALSVIALEALLIGTLLLQRRRLRRTEADLRENRARYRALFEEAPDAIYLNDLEGRFLDGNAEAERLLGHPREALIGKNFLEADILPEDQIEKTLRLLDRNRRGEATGPDELTLRNRAGQPFKVKLKTCVLRESSGSVVLGIVRDITAEMALEAQLRQAQKMEAVGQLAGGVAHDFNNLLQVISGYAEIAMAEIDEEHVVAPFLSEVLKASGRAQNLVRQLLVFSRREASHPRSLNLNEIVEGMMKMVGRVLGEHIDLTFAPDPELPAVEADPHLMEQVLMNLCVNARDAMGDGGALCIRTHTRRLSETEPFSSDPLFRPGPFAVLSVSDTGCGISTEVRERIFEPFFSTKEVGKGTGLGLATVYGIVKQHEGFIQVGDQEGGGARFDVYLPAGDGAPEIPPAPPGGKNARTAGGETILLAEDDQMVRRLATRILERAGFRVLKAKDGDEAAETFRAEARRIDLAILDVVMPRRSGRAVYDEIHAVRPELPILFASGYSYNMLEAGGVHPEAFEVLPKPFRSEELLERVHRLLADASTRRPERPAPV